MSTVLVSHAACLNHDTGAFHPECAERLTALSQGLERETFWTLHRVTAPRATREQILRAHDPRHYDYIESFCPPEGSQVHIDPDTVMSHGSWDAALYAAGAVIASVDGVITGEFRNAFCAVRPPGHHAEAAMAMGFCLFNNIAIGAKHARAAHGLERIAVVDVDVHHGNGTQDIFYDDPGLFYASTHQQGAFPGTGYANEMGCAHNIVNAPLSPGAGSAEWRSVIETKVLPPLRAFAPQLLMISMGFDAHAADPLGQMRLSNDDFGWVTRQLCDVAAQYCENRLVSVLEGGYDLRALADAGAEHVRALMGF